MAEPKKLHHIALAVKDVDAAQEFFVKNLAATVERPKRVLEAERSVSVFLSVGGIKIELLQSTDPEGPVAKLIERKGEGLHSVSFEVDDVEAAAKDLEGKGLRIVGKTARYAFIHPRDAFGVMVELHAPD